MGGRFPPSEDQDPRKQQLCKKILHMKGLENRRVCRTLPFFWSCVYDDYFLAWSNPFYQSPWLHLSMWHTRRISEGFFQNPGMEQPTQVNTWEKFSFLTPQGLGTSSTQDRIIHLLELTRGRGLHEYSVCAGEEEVPCSRWEIFFHLFFTTHIFSVVFNTVL